ncbi:LysR family transcriptional regulator [Brevibacterium sp. 91QC2O2]|uniref:LysR family transcriptional regulator n=1 Tax=Brevibacterium sp. 91QC2O2 TaxID=2968458 RepID=UPI00211C4389|nr:LysR family transcriptional regulator [Brevibacterium sp. 91QC2O2]MCQ9368017.1 LysR family transcriptional regulator [Brevibacterium sp. 91QC2O2]
MAIVEPSLKRLRYFVALAEYGKFQAAADEVGISQPALSAELKRLEDFVGTPLFHRAPATVLTAAGAALLPYAKAAVGAAQDFNARALQLRTGAASTLTVGTVMTFVHRGLPEAIRNFTRHNPGIIVKTVEASSAAQSDMLLGHEIDVACGHMPLDSPLVDCREASQEGFWLCTGATETVTTVAQTASLPYVIFRRSASPLYYEHVVGICRAAGFEPRIEHETTSWAAAVEMVAHGLGVSLVPGPVAGSYRTDARLRLHRIDRGAEAPQAWVSVRREAAGTPADRLARGIIRAAGRAAESVTPRP